ncbi:MAG: hypothetical protein PHQ81_04875 [Methanofollis sp.]|nr:hypothetical protein [Methanofollis sp.]
MKTGRNPLSIFIGGGFGGRPRPSVEERVENFWKEALQLEEIFTSREFWDMLHENDREDPSL